MYRAFRYAFAPALLLPWSAPAASPWPAPAVAERYVQEALTQNLALQAQAQDVAAARARLEQSSGTRQPRVDFLARYSRADGGRTIDVPAGDLLNPAYRTLNELLAAQGRPAAFPSVPNLSIPLLREREQDTRLRLTAPVYNSELSRLHAARRSALAAATFQQTALRRDIRLAALAAYYHCLRTTAAESILRSALETTGEALRVSRVLAANDQATEDRVLRAEADELAVKQQLADAARDRAAALYAFNVVLHRPLDTPVEPPPADELTTLTAALSSAPVPDTNVPAAREELAALLAVVAENTELEAAYRARTFPSLSLMVESGIQGESYRFGNNAGYTQASLVGEYNLWDGRQRRSEIDTARAQRRKAELRLEIAREQLALEVRFACDELVAARTALPAALRRTEAAARALTIVTARDREGLVNQLAFLDARQAHTAAQLNLEITRQRLFVAAARVDRALATSPID